MRVAIHQPQFFPWLGYLDKIASADLFIFLDNVQFKKNEWQNRNRIRSADGWIWLTVPIRQRFPQTIREVQIAEGVDWKKKHLGALEASYGRAPFFDRTFKSVALLYDRAWDDLLHLNLASVQILLEGFGLKPKTLLASELSSNGLAATDRLVALCRAVGADEYLAGAGGADYMEMEKFETAKIRVTFQDFVHPIYPQRFEPFVPALSALDLLFNCGPDSPSLLGPRSR